MRAETRSGVPDGSWLGRSKAAPVLAGLVTAALAWWVWGFSADPLAMVQDENAYRLQAGLFAAGKWADPMPPAELFFDQMHVLSHPVRAAKYPPGQALALAPGFAARVPVAWPLVCDFASAALLFALARRASGGAVALLTWIVWLAGPGGLSVRSSFFSELTTSALWFFGWWALWNWKDTRRSVWILLFGLTLGWAAITRPLTAIAFALPAGVYALFLAARRRAWAAFAAATLLGATVLVIWPLWSLKTTGDAFDSPLAVYTRDVMPWDRPGFGLRDGAARWEPAPDVRGDFVEGFRQLHARHTIANLPQVLGERLTAVGRDLWGRGRWPLFACALLGVFVSPHGPQLAFASVVCIFLLYLAYAHFANWTVYYVETYGVLAYATGLGLWRCFRLLESRSKSPALSGAGLGLLAGALVVAAAPSLLEARERREVGLHESIAFADALRTLPRRPAIVFVRYGTRHDPHRSLIVNGPDLEKAPVWVVYDRGAENTRLLRIAPNRAPFLYDEETRALRPLETVGRGTASSP